MGSWAACIACSVWRVIFFRLFGDAALIGEWDECRMLAASGESNPCGRLVLCSKDALAAAEKIAVALWAVENVRLMARDMFGGRCAGRWRGLGVYIVGGDATNCDSDDREYKCRKRAGSILASGLAKWMCETGRSPGGHKCTCEGVRLNDMLGFQRLGDSMVG